MPRLLDLFCGAGGCSVGYARAGFEVVGVDNRPQPHYPYEFHQADAMTFPIDGYDAIHASPPCQGYSRLRHLPWLVDRAYPMLLDPTRDRLAAAGVPWVIENVEDAPLERHSSLFGTHGCLLCGLMFGLPLYRHRVFETSFGVTEQPHPRHVAVLAPGGASLAQRYRGTGVTGVLRGRTAGVERSFGTVVTTDPDDLAPFDPAAALGIDWMTRKELTQAIPPAYTHHIGQQLLTHLQEPP